MNSKHVIDLSPKLFSIISIMSIITIMIHVITDIAYVGRIDHKAIIPAIILFVFSKNNRVRSISKINN